MLEEKNADRISGVDADNANKVTPPEVEIEEKYLVASRSDLDALMTRAQELYPGMELIYAANPETSYIYTDVDLAMISEIELFLEPEDRERISELDQKHKLSLTVKRKATTHGKDYSLTIKASTDPLHDLKRIEIEDPMASGKTVELLELRGVRPDSIWNSWRRKFKLDATTVIDFQQVSGYGFTIEVESATEARIREIESELGIEPLTRNLKAAAYKRYCEKGLEEIGETFNDEDWLEIGKETGEVVMRNMIN